MDWANKHIGTILRIAGLIHVATKEECGTEIQADTIRKAIDIGRYFLAHARYAYSMMGTDLNIQRAQFVLGKLMNKGIQEIKRSELFQMCRGKFFKKTEDLLPTLSCSKTTAISGRSSRRSSARGVRRMYGFI